MAYCVRQQTVQKSVGEEPEKDSSGRHFFFIWGFYYYLGVTWRGEREMFFRNIPTKTVMGTGGSFQVEGWSWLLVWKHQKSREVQLVSACCKMCGRCVSLHIPETIGHQALPVPFQLPQTGTAGEGREGITACLPPRAGNGCAAPMVMGPSYL